MAAELQHPTLHRSYQDGLGRKGVIDQQRHKQRLTDAIRKNRGDLIRNRQLLGHNGKGLVRIPLRGLEQDKFRFDESIPTDQVGTGNGNAKVGDVLGKAGATDEHELSASGGSGIERYDIPYEEVEDVLFEGWELPFLQNKAQSEITAPNIVFTDIRKTGPIGRLQKKRTIHENIKRNAMAGDPHFFGVRNEDLRFLTWEEIPRQSTNAVVLAIKDISGSAENAAFREAAQATYTWIKNFLRRKYESVEIVFITHADDAKEVDEDAFLTLTSDGGTRFSKPYELASKIIDKRYPPVAWNIYPIHFTDGHNFEEDFGKTLDAAAHLAEKSNAFGYFEMTQRGLTDTFRQFRILRSINQRVISQHMDDRTGVYPALSEFFRSRDLQLAA
ncbi:MAG: DUF444 family protein [Candidatus Levybacteria bacterium]|nr:DUF444 family protein [Candidatus Levybacteria bacterium]